jgi:hypothetical protein
VASFGAIGVGGSSIGFVPSPAARLALIGTTAFRTTLGGIWLRSAPRGPFGFDRRDRDQQEGGWLRLVRARECWPRTKLGSLGALALIGISALALIGANGAGVFRDGLVLMMFEIAKSVEQTIDPSPPGVLLGSQFYEASGTGDLLQTPVSLPRPRLGSKKMVSLLFACEPWSSEEKCRCLKTFGSSTSEFRLSHSHIRKIPGPSLNGMPTPRFRQPARVPSFS